MTILPSSIRLLESERMTDTTDGGGRRTNRVIPDGVAGNIFPKVSRVDSVYGRVNLRKVYPHINTASLDVYAGAHFVITDAPDNNRISVLAFSTDSDFDTRTAARDRIESYVIAGPQSRMTLYGRQLQGTQALLAYQRVEEPLPEIGDVYAISTEVADVTTAQQFVRVQDVAHEVRTFEDASGSQFERRVLTLKIGSPLRYEFAGLGSPSRYASDSAAVSGKLRTTTVADAARYFGIQPVVGSLAEGALTLSVASVYAAIVPSTQRETPLSLAAPTIGGFAVDSADAEVTEPGFMRATGATTFTYRAARAIKPGTLRISDGYISSDDGAGAVESNSTGNGYVGVVDYESGTLSLTAKNAGSYTVMTVSYVPQVSLAEAVHTKAIEVTLATRGTVYSVPLLPIPAPGSLIVDYRALGKWYRLRDNGSGELVGADPAYGTGTVDYVTGGATVTLGALPDVGSSVLLSWGSPVHYELISNTTVGANSPAGAGAVGKVEQSFTLTELPIKPGSISIAFTAGASTYTVTDSSGVLSGGGVTGTVNYTTGQCALAYGAKVPNAGGEITVSYAQLGPAVPDAPTVASFGGPLSGGTINTGRSWVAGTVMVYASFVDRNGQAKTVRLGDTGTGGLQVRLPNDTYRSEWRFDTTQIAANINYSTGVITVTSPISTSLNVDSGDGSGYVPVVTTHALTDGQTVFVTGRTGASSVDVPQVVALSLDADAPLKIDLTSNTRRLVIEGSLMFDFAGKTYVDRNGTLYNDLAPATGSGSEAGTINYETGVATLTDWEAGADAALTMRAGLVVRGRWTASAVSFRTAGSPLRPASLFVQCTAADGELLASTTDQNGIITGPSTTGEVEQTMGVVTIAFDKPVMPGTLRYSAVVLSNLPLSATILGLDPVRLPSDGRVPIFRPADVALLHHTASYNAGTPTAGSTISVGRTGVDALWLEDADRKKLAADMYAVDLAAGTATMALDMSLAGYTAPIYARHRIEETVLLSDVQINGVLSLTAPLSRAFPSGSYLSGALLYGDLQARATNLFDQQTWTGEWQSSLIGDQATGQYNDIDYPVEVLNNGAITERWRLNFTSANSFQLIGENMGVIATGTTGADLQPVNPLTTQPYFTLRAAGFGGGWSAGNQLRFDTVAAAPPTWLARCVLPGATLAGDSFDAQLRGDVD